MLLLSDKEAWSEQKRGCWNGAKWKDWQGIVEGNDITVDEKGGIGCEKKAGKWIESVKW